MKYLNITACSKTGCVRSNNEDMMLVGNKFIRSDAYRNHFSITPSGRYIMAVADGMGGHEAGEVASSSTLIDLQYFFYDLPKELDISGYQESMVGWLDSINRKLHSKGLANRAILDMGTTLVALAYYEGHLFRMHCGDSRLYLFRDGELKQLTVDHSLNTIMGEEKHSNIITNCIGAGCKTSFMEICDIGDEVKAGDILLLCSDGLNDMVSDKTIAQMLARGDEAEELAQAAVDAGGFDNVSTCVIKVE